MSLDFESPLPCPECGANCQVQRKIWVTPGDEEVDVGEIDYEADWDGMAYCPECNEVFDHPGSEEYEQGE